jgi:hypothetical protein
MPYVCRSCDYYDESGNSNCDCPECGGAMRFTMIGRATATATLDAPAPREEWRNPYKYGYDEIEAPWAFRYAQIGVGITLYWIVSRVVGLAILVPMILSMAHVPPEKAAAVLIAASLAIYCVAAVAGGAVAGFWARSWVVQGLGVVAGISLVPLVIALVTAPAASAMVLISAALTCPFTVLGAFIGHLIVKPTRVPHS